MNANEYVDYRVPQQLSIYEQHWYPEDLEYIREYVFRSGWRLTVNPEDHADARVMDALKRRIQEAHRSGLPRAWQCLEYQDSETPEEDYDEEQGDGVCHDEGCVRRFREQEAAAM